MRITNGERGLAICFWVGDFQSENVKTKHVGITLCRPTLAQTARMGHPGLGMASEKAKRQNLTMGLARRIPD
jgi:hypothetical protein